MVLKKLTSLSIGIDTTFPHDISFFVLDGRGCIWNIKERIHAKVAETTWPSLLPSLCWSLWRQLLLALHITHTLLAFAITKGEGETNHKFKDASLNLTTQR